MAKDRVIAHGFSRVMIVNHDGSVAGDSGFVGPNQIVDTGFRDYLVSTLGAVAGSKVLTHAALGTGTQPGTTDTALAGEVTGTSGGTSRAALTNATTTGSKTLDCRATFNSTQSFVTTTEDISNIGLFNTESTGSLFCGNTFASSSCATNQNVNVTYQIIFS